MDTVPRPVVDFRQPGLTMQNRGSPEMPWHMCDDTLPESSYGLDFSVISKAWVLNVAPN